MIQKNILITGGSRGIGKLIAKHLASQGHSLVIIARYLDELSRASSEIKASFPSSEIIYYKCDVSNYAECREVLAKIKKLDALINCAGVLGPVGPFGESKIDEWKKTIEINFIGTANIIHVSLPHLSKSGRGKIINFSGGGSAYARKYHTAYGSSKCAVVRFTETLALEYPNMDINVIAPGAHNTAIWNNETYDKKPEKWADQERLKSLITFLISPLSDNISGRFIHIMDKWEEIKAGLEDDSYKLRRIEK